MKTLQHIKLPLLMVLMLTAARMPAAAQTSATPRKSMKPIESPLQTNSIPNNDSRAFDDRNQFSGRDNSVVDTTLSGKVDLVKRGEQSAGPTSTAAITRPNAVDDALTTNPGTRLAIPVLDNDTDPQNLPLKVIAIGTPTNGTATFNDSTVIYTPNAGFYSIDVFTYTISNGMLRDTAFVDAIVLPPPDLIWENDIFDPLALGSLNGQNGWTIVSGNVSPVVITDSDPNRGKTVQIDAAPGHPISVTKDVPDQTSGRHAFSFLVRVSGATHLPCEAAVEIQTDPSTGWSNKARFCFGPSITINYNPSGAETTIVALTVPDQWYLIHGEISLNTHLLDVWVDGQLKASGILVHPGPIRSLGITGQDQGGAGVVVVDDLTGVTANGTSGGDIGGGTGTPGTPVYWINAVGGLWSDPANWSTRRVPTTTDHAIITLGGTYTVTVDQSDAVNSLTLGAGSGLQTLWIKGNGRFGSVTLTVNNDIPNSGLIRLKSEVAGYASNLTIVNGLLINKRVIQATVGSGGPRVITGRVLNRCRVDVQPNLTLIGTFTNRAKLEIDTTKQMTLHGGAQVFNQNGGEIGGNGVLLLSDGATLNFNRGATTGANSPTLTNAMLNFGPAATGVATFIMQGQGSMSQLSGDIGAEQRVWIRGNGQPGNAIITALSGFINAGVIRLESQVAGYQSDLTIANGVLTNTGVINVNQGASGPRIISGTVVNQGAVNVHFNMTFNGTFSNHGTVTIDSARTMSLDSNTDVFNQNAGTIADKGVLTLSDGATLNFNRGTTTGAAPTLTSAKLNFGSATTGVATFIMQGATSQLSGDIGAEQRVWIRGNGQTGNAIITALSGFINAGVIRLESQVAGYQSDLIIANGILTNTGVINVNQGSSGFRVITGKVVNRGRVNVNYTLSINGTFTTSGIFGIGLGPGNNQFDQLQVFGPDTLGGTLNLNVAPGFDPPFNATFQIVRCDSCSGVFATVNGSDLGPGKRLRVIYNPTNVTLQVAPEEAIGGLTTTNNGPTPLDSATTLTATLTAGSNVNYTWNFGDGTTGNGRIVTHTYTAAGNYTARVTATNSLGSATATTAVNVFIAPITGLKASNDDSTQLGRATTLKATITSGSRVSYSWDFGDNTTDNGAVVSHTYPRVGVYTAVVKATNAVSTLKDTTQVRVWTTTTAVKDKESENRIPTAFMLSQNYPNPFNPVTTIQFSVPRASYVRLKIYNSSGAEVDKLVDRQVAAGTYNVNWDASRLASGFYLYRLEAEGFAQTKKLLLMK